MMRLACTIICVVFICAGCSSNPSASKPSSPIAGLKAATTRPAHTEEQIIQLYLTNVLFGDWYLARLDAACDAIAQDAHTAEARYEALRIKAIQGGAVYSILTSPNPFVQMCSLQTLVELTRLKWVDEGRATAIFGERGKLLVDALDEIQNRGREKALGMISETELNSIRESARRWRNENREIIDIEFIRFEDFVAELASSLTQEEHDDFMANVQSAVSGLSETRLLAVRSLYLMSRYPRVLHWQMEAQMANLARQPETMALVDDMDRITKIVEALHGETAELQATLEAFPQKLASSLTSDPLLKDALFAANKGIARGETVSTQLAGVENSLRHLDDSVAGLAHQFDQINQSFNPESVQKMAQDAKASAAQQARELIILMTLCLAGLVVLHTLLRRWSTRR